MEEPPVCPAFPRGPLVVPVGAGWSGRCWGWWPAGRVDQSFPAVLPGPVLGEVDDQSPRGRGEAARDRDQLPADGRGGGFGVEDRRDGPGGAGEVERDRGQHEPGSVCCNRAI